MIVPVIIADLLHALLYLNKEQEINRGLSALSKREAPAIDYFKFFLEYYRLITATSYACVPQQELENCRKDMQTIEKFTAENFPQLLKLEQY